MHEAQPACATHRAVQKLGDVPAEPVVGHVKRKGNGAHDVVAVNVADTRLLEHAHLPILAGDGPPKRVVGHVEKQHGRKGVAGQPGQVALKVVACQVEAGEHGERRQANGDGPGKPSLARCLYSTPLHHHALVAGELDNAELAVDMPVHAVPGARQGVERIVRQVEGRQVGMGGQRIGDAALQVVVGCQELHEAYGVGKKRIDTT